MPRKQQQQHDGIVHGSRSIHRAQGVSVNPFGYPPLSDKALLLTRRLNSVRPNLQIPTWTGPQDIIFTVFRDISQFLGVESLGATSPPEPPVG